MYVNWTRSVVKWGAFNQTEEMGMGFEMKSLSPLLSVFDMPTAMHFYRTLLGFELVNHSPFLSDSQYDFHWAMLRRNGVELMLNTAYDEGERPSQPEPRRVAAHSDTVLYFGCPDVDGAYTELLAKGLPVKAPTVAPYGMKQLTVSDPDGYLLCFQWPA